MVEGYRSVCCILFLIWRPNFLSDGLMMFVVCLVFKLEERFSLSFLVFDLVVLRLREWDEELRTALVMFFILYTLILLNIVSRWRVIYRIFKNIK